MSMPLKNPLDKEDVPRNGNRINSGSKRADLIGAGSRAQSARPTYLEGRTCS
jgi:hypothetical protein